MSEEKKEQEVSSGKKKKKYLKGTFLLYFVLVMAVGVPTVAYAIYCSTDKIDAILFFVLFVLFFAGLIFICLTFLLNVLMKNVDVDGDENKTEKKKIDGKKVSLELYQAWLKNDANNVSKLAPLFLVWLAPKLVWIFAKVWMVGVVVALVLAFAGFLGSALLVEQNEAIKQQTVVAEKQTTAVEKQAESLDRQIELLEKQNNIVSNSGKYEALWELYNSDSFKIKKDAFLELHGGGLKKFVGISLHDLVLSGVDLSDCNFLNADLKSIVLFRSNLTRINLKKSNLDSAKLIAINLTGADLSEASLIEADLSGGKTLINIDKDIHKKFGKRVNKQARLQFAQYLRMHDIPRFSLAEWSPETCLSKANLSGADLFKADLSGAELEGANLRRANLRRADLGMTKLSSANLSSADLRGANLVGADLRKANLQNTNLSGANLEGADLSEARNLTVDQICKCRNIKYIDGLSREILLKIRKRKPKRMEWWDDPEKGK